MTRLMTIDSTTLIPRYCHLFENEDFAELGRGSAINCLYWISAVKSAVAASILHCQQLQKWRQEFQLQHKQHESSDNPLPQIPEYQHPIVPIKPDFWWKKRRLKWTPDIHRNRWISCLVQKGHSFVYGPICHCSAPYQLDEKDKSNALTKNNK